MRDQAIVVAMVLSCVAGCGSASSDGGVSGDSGSEDGAPLVPDHGLAKAWAHGLCDNYDKCCAAEGKTEDHAACEAAVESFIAGPVDAAMARGAVSDPSKFADCTAALAMTVDQCTDESVLTKDLLWRVNEACFPAVIGTKHVGETCSTTFDCIQEPGTMTTCLSYSGGSSGSGSLCQQQVRADLGEPCSFSSGDPLVHTCDPSKPLTCVSGKCAKNPGAGEACFTTVIPSCDAADQCVGTSCTPRLDVGATCAANGDCKAGLRCDATSMCAQVAKVGESCATASDCASQSCTGGICHLASLFFGAGSSACN